MMMEFPNDVVSRDLDEQFLWGSGLLIAPVLEENAVKKQVYLPDNGWWYHNGVQLQSNFWVELDAPKASYSLFEILCSAVEIWCFLRFLEGNFWWNVENPKLRIHKKKNRSEDLSDLHLTFPRHEFQVYLAIRKKWNIFLFTFKIAPPTCTNICKSERIFFVQQNSSSHYALVLWENLENRNSNRNFHSKPSKMTKKENLKTRIHKNKNKKILWHYEDEIPRFTCLFNTLF